VSEEPAVTKRFIYIAEDDSPTHTGKVSAYLVERYNSDTIVARISPIGLLGVDDAEDRLESFTTNHGLSPTGEWKTIRKGTHRLMRVVKGNFD
jgi:hypothetical protein